MRIPSKSPECLAQRRPNRHRANNVSPFREHTAVKKNSAELQDAIEQLIELRGVKRGSHMVKEYIRKWYRASYPFARMFISVETEGAAVLACKIAFNLVDAGTQSVWPRLWWTSRSRSHGGA